MTAAPRDIHDLLTAHPFFAGLPIADVELIAGCGRNVRFAAGDTLFDEGGPADTFYVLRRGRIAIETHAPAREPLVIMTLGHGDVAGWSWLFPPYRWQFGGRALDDVSAIALDGACLRAKCDDEPRLGYRLMQRFARLATERLQATRIQLLDLYGAPEAQRT